MALSALVRLACVACLLAGAVGYALPSAAFDASTMGARTVTAPLVADPNAYVAPIIHPCAVSRAVGGSCSFAIFNNATTTQTFTVTRQSQTSAIVTAFELDDVIASDDAATGLSRAVGQASLVEITLDACASCGSEALEWMIEGRASGAIDVRLERVPFAVTYS